MARSSALITFAAVSLCACSHTPPPLTVPQVIAQIDALNGKTVRVKGYLGTCAGYDCVLFPDRAGKAAFDEWIAHLRDRDSRNADEPVILGIGGEETFDHKAAPFQNSAVIITGKVTNMCRYKGKPACMDRSTDIMPTHIVSAKDQ